MRKMGVYLGLVEDDETLGEGAEAYERASGRGEPASGPTRSERTEFSDPRYARGERTATVEREAVAVVPREWSEAEPAYNGEYTEEYAYPSYRITTLHPRTYNEARTIGEHFRSSTPVIMNLSEMDDADAKRLVDFAAGLTFGLHGRLERVTAKVFLLSPNNVTVTAQDKARIAEGGFFNQS
jgi:cell division inhibitor SepF